ncbi:MAG: hypothetical protein AB7V04_01745 [Desulfomonilaceae bacterium]
MNIVEGEGGQEGQDSLDQFDVLVEHFRPIEKLFQLMGAVAPDAFGGTSLVRGCSEIGLNLSAQFREKLERVLLRAEDG